MDRRTVHVPSPYAYQKASWLVPADYPWHLVLPRIVSDRTDPYAVLGVLIEGAVQTIAQRIPAEQQMETAATLVQLLEERLKAHGVPGGDR